MGDEVSIGPDVYQMSNNSAVRQKFYYFIGPSLLAATLLHENFKKSNRSNIYLPAGKWVDIETGNVHSGPATLTGHDMSLEKIPVFIGGKGVYVSRIDDASPLQAVVFPIATGGSRYTFTHPDGTSKSTVVNGNTGWNPATLKVTDATTGSPSTFTSDAITGAIRFALLTGHSYTLGGGS